MFVFDSSIDDKLENMSTSRLNERNFLRFIIRWDDERITCFLQGNSYEPEM